MSARAFAGMGGTKPSTKNPFFEPDERYKVEVEKNVLVTSQTGEDYFIIEAKILESSTPKLKPGTIAAQVIKLPGTYKMGLANVKAYLAAANGIDPSDSDAVEAALGIDEDGNDMAVQVAILATSDDNPLAGTVLNLRTTETTTKRGSKFTIHNWSPADE